MRIFIVVGETSGDSHASRIASKLKSENNSIQLFGWGGDSMKTVGVQILCHLDELNFMGYKEVFLQIPKLYKLERKFQQQIKEVAPDLILYVDFSSFNLRMAKWTANQGRENWWYIAPKTWASRPSRNHYIKKYINRLFCIFLYGSV